MSETSEQGAVEPGVGDVLANRYRLEKELGRGGFGVVFRATHLDTQRTVAVKVLLADQGKRNARAVERFRREAILSASLEYPNTVDVFDYGQTKQGGFFLVMEYLRGTPLSEVIEREAPLSPHRVVHITRQVLYSLMEAHAKGIVHRDIKPENIMLVPLMYDANYIKVMDFGIAKMVGGGPQITQAGQTFGTPRYMSPEQLQDGSASPETDIYAVGLVIYEMFTGHPAIDTNNLAETITKVIFGPPIELDEHEHVPEPFKRLVRRACSRESSERYGDVGALLEALCEWSGPSPEMLAVDGVTTPVQSPTPEAARPRSVTEVVGRDEVERRLETITDMGRGESGAVFSDTMPARPPIAPSEGTLVAVEALPDDSAEQAAAGSEVTTSEVLTPAEREATEQATQMLSTFDPMRTSLVPTHAGAGRAPAQTMLVASGEVLSADEAPSDKRGVMLQTGCLLALLALICTLILAVVVLLLMLTEVI